MTAEEKFEDIKEEEEGNDYNKINNEKNNNNINDNINKRNKKKDNIVCTCILI